MFRSPSRTRTAPSSTRARDGGRRRCATRGPPWAGWDQHTTAPPSTADSDTSRIALAELGRLEAAATVYSAALRTVAAAAHPAYGWPRVEARVKTSIETTAFEAAWASGARMDRDGAVAIVVAELDVVEAELALDG